jgi:hypothetical protein
VATRGRPIAPARIPGGRSCPKRQGPPKEPADQARVLQTGTAKAGWAEPLARVFGENGFRYPRCGSPMVLRCLVLQTGFGTARDDEAPTEPRERDGAALAAVEGSMTGGAGSAPGWRPELRAMGRFRTKKAKSVPLGPASRGSGASEPPGSLCWGTAREPSALRSAERSPSAIHWLYGPPRPPTG